MTMMTQDSSLRDAYPWIFIDSKPHPGEPISERVSQREGSLGKVKNKAGYVNKDDDQFDRPDAWSFAFAKMLTDSDVLL